VKGTGLNFWTSGSNEGENCHLQKVYSWCSLDTLLLPELLTQSQEKFYWRNMTAQNPETDRCLGFNFNGSSAEITGLEHQSCNSTGNYICEVQSHKI